MKIWEEEFDCNWKKWILSKKIVTILSIVKLVSTAFILPLSYMFDSMIPPSMSFAVPFFTAVALYDEPVIKIGVFIFVMLLTYVLVSIISPFLIKFGSDAVSTTGIICVIALNACDVVCGVVSFVEMQSVDKILNIAFSALVIIIACFALYFGGKKCYTSFQKNK